MKLLILLCRNSKIRWIFPSLHSNGNSLEIKKERRKMILDLIHRQSLAVCSITMCIFILLYSSSKNSLLTIPIFLILGIEICIKFGFLIFIWPTSVIDWFWLVGMTLWYVIKFMQGILILLQVLNIIDWKISILLIPYWIGNAILFIACISAVLLGLWVLKEISKTQY